MSKECELYERLCNDCGECDICDLDKNKKCDNCSQCIGDTGDYRVLKVETYLNTPPAKTYKLKK